MDAQRRLRYRRGGGAFFRPFPRGAPVPFRTAAITSLMLAAGAAFALAAAWYFQLVVGLAPCPLCLDQRIPYYLAIPLSLVAFALARGGRTAAAKGMLMVLAALFAIDAGIAVYHAGIEWRLWPGPASCTGAPVLGAGDILSAIKGARVPRCDEATWHLFGLSMAGWNAILAAGLATVALAGATSGRK